MAKKAVSRRSIPVVLGGGGMRGVGLLGLLRFLEEQLVLIGKIFGVSIGSIVGAMYTNGRKTEEIEKVFLDDLRTAWWPLFQSLIPPLNPFRLMGGGLIDLVPLMRHLVEKYDLKPNDQLQIIAYDVLRREPVVFSGTDYDLAAVLAASCAVPGIMRPVIYTWRGRTMYLYDGAVYHPQPGEFSPSPAIIGKLIDFPFINLIFPERRGDFVASISQATANFLTPLSRGQVKELLEHGYRSARESLEQPIRLGLIPTRT